MRRVSLLFLFALASSAWAEGTPATNAILVDKKTNTLQVVEYDDGAYKVLKTYHATLGKVTGDKQDEDDLKTPEGIYTFTAKRTPPNLPRKFGVMAYPLNFPNTYDKLAGRTGSGIMLHATDTPDRLAKNYDSEGCVVVRNEELEEIAPRIRLGLTPILIFPELTAEYLSPGKDGPLKSFFDRWVAAWEGKDIDAYIGSYHSDFTYEGKNRDAYRAYKASLNQHYASIKIGPENVRFYRHPKYSLITFTQNYQSKLKGGGWGHRSRGTKILYVAEEQGQPRIIAEAYTTLNW